LVSFEAASLEGASTTAPMVNLLGRGDITGT